MYKLNAIVLTSLSLFAATSALAQTGPSTLTRAAVIAEYQRAQLAGELRHNEADVSQISVAAPQVSLTRAEVQAEYLRAKQAGELRLVDYPDLGTSTASVKSSLTRAVVRNEVQRARATGELAEAHNDFGSPHHRRAYR